MSSTPPPPPQTNLPPHSPPTAPTSPATKRTRPEDRSSSIAAALAPTTTMPASSSSSDALQVKLLSEHARAPTRGSAFAAGYDLYCSQDTTIPAHGRAAVPTDVSVAVPAGTYGRVAPRSGLAAKHGLQTGAGVVDADYRGAVFVLLFNHGDSDFSVARGDRCAQLVLERIVTPDVLVVDQLEDTVRGGGGFGSTGGFAGK